MEEQDKPLKRKRAATQAQIEKDLKRIYATEEPVDLKTIERVTVRRRIPLIIGVVVGLFVLAGITWAGIMRFGGGTRFTDRVSISIEGPALLRSGEAQTWTVHYKNDERLPIARAEISLRLPAAVTVISTTPAPSSAPTTWGLGTIPPYGEGVITIIGRTLETVDAPLAFQAVLSYRPANFNSDFQKIATWNGRVTDAVIEATLEVPEETVPGDTHTFTVTIKKREGLSEDAALPDLKVRFDPPRAIVVTKAAPAFTKTDERAWITPPPTDKELHFSATGEFAANASGDVPVRVDIGTVNAEGNFLTLVPLTAVVKVLQGDLAVTIIRDGSTESGTVGFGDTLHLSVDYENKGERTITDAEIWLTLDGTPVAGNQSTIDWATLSDARKGRRQNNTLVWTKREIPELAELKPKDKGSVDVSVKTVGGIFTTSDRTYAIDITGTGKIGSMGGKRIGKTVSTPVLRATLNTNATLSAAALHSNGPLPPRVGAETKYKIVWTLVNALHEITGIKATAVLAPGVEWKNETNITAGDLRFDEATRTVTWTLNRLPTSITSVGVDFTVSMTPADGDIGKVLPLVSASSLSATDKATGAALTKTDAALDTNLQGDPENEGKGKVQP